MTISSIEWTDRTWNPVRGCTRVSPGCVNCYAERLSARNLPGLRSPTTGEPFAIMKAGGPRWTGAVEFLPHKLAEPLSWRKPARVFVNSMSDLFHEDLTNEQIAAVFGVMAACPHLTFQVLTKRPERAVEWFRWVEERRGSRPRWEVFRHLGLAHPEPINVSAPDAHAPWPLPNVWLGVSAENQETADERIPLLLQCPAAVRFVSYEPALGPVNFARPYWLTERPCPVCEAEDSLSERRGSMSHPINCGWRKDQGTATGGIDWIIVGGESGPGARPFDVEWARSAVRQCREAGVPVFVKQLGAAILAPPGLSVKESPPRGATEFRTVHAWSAPTGAACWESFRLCDPKGGDPSEWPEDLRIREFPEAPHA